MAMALLNKDQMGQAAHTRSVDSSAVALEQPCRRSDHEEQLGHRTVATHQDEGTC